MVLLFLNLRFVRVRIIRIFYGFFQKRFGHLDLNKGGKFKSGYSVIVECEFALRVLGIKLKNNYCWDLFFSLNFREN